MIRFLNTILPVGSRQLNEHLAKFKVGTKSGEWTIKEVRQVEVPPHPQTGETCTQVVLTLEKPGEDPSLDIPTITPEPLPAKPSEIPLGPSN